MTAVVMFYHLTRSGLDETVVTILNRALGQGWPIMIRSPNKGLLNHLDAKLWAEPEDSFLPHGVEGGPSDADQPVLLGSGTITNRARGVLLLGGATVDPAELPGLDRVWLLFDSADEVAVQAARGQWTRMTGWGLAAQYWSDETGPWVKKMEKPATAV
jgi:DNA polymerase-3 subunit chi